VSGVLNPFTRQVEAASAVNSRLRRVRRTSSSAVDTRQSRKHRTVLLPARQVLLRARIVFGGVCLSVCLFVCPHKISKTSDQELMLLGSNMPHGER